MSLAGLSVQLAIAHQQLHTGRILVKFHRLACPARRYCKKITNLRDRYTLTNSPQARNELLI